MKAYSYKQRKKVKEKSDYKQQPVSQFLTLVIIFYQWCFFFALEVYSEEIINRKTIFKIFDTKGK